MADDGPRFPQLDRLSRYRTETIRKGGFGNKIYRRRGNKGFEQPTPPDVVDFIEGERPENGGDDE